MSEKKKDYIPYGGDPRVMEYNPEWTKTDVVGYGWLNDYVKDVLPITEEMVADIYKKMKECGGGDPPDICIAVTQEMVDDMVETLGYEYTKAWLDGDIDKCIEMAKED